MKNNFCKQLVLLYPVLKSKNSETNLTTNGTCALTRAASTSPSMKSKSKLTIQRQGGLEPKKKKDKSHAFTIK